jgi:alpha-D-xyloside xylohydrolase
MTSIVHRGGVLAWVLAASYGGGVLAAQNAGVTLDRDGSTVVLEPYAPNILRVTMSTLKDEATAGPGYGIVAKPDAAGWTHETTAEGDTYKSARLTVFIAAPATPQRRPDGSFPRGPRKNFGGFNRGPFMTVTGADGKPVTGYAGLGDGSAERQGR